MRRPFVLTVWNNVRMQAVQVQHYIQRATDFFNGMQLTRDEEPYRNSSALLAIHSAVSYTDALRTGLGDENLSGDDHRQAADALRPLLNTRSVKAQDGVGHLQYLISRKSSVAYGSERLGANEFLSLVIRAERFAKWANGIGRQLNLEGWNYDDQ